MFGFDRTNNVSRSAVASVREIMKPETIIEIRVVMVNVLFSHVCVVFASCYLGTQAERVAEGRDSKDVAAPSAILPAVMTELFQREAADRLVSQQISLAAFSSPAMYLCPRSLVWTRKSCARDLQAKWNQIYGNLVFADSCLGRQARGCEIAIVSFLRNDQIWAVK